MKKVLDIFDYIFYRLYKFFSSHRLFTGMEVIDAISMIFFTIFIPIASLIGYIFHHLDIVVDSIPPIRYLGMLLLFIVGYLPLMKRYMYNKSIKKYNYRVFNERWGNEDPKLHKKRGWLLIFLFVSNIIIFPIVLVLLIYHYHVL